MTESLLKVPRYSILRHVGSGAHADVFQARDRISEKMAALKLLRRDRFGTPEEDILQREYELLLDLQEPALPEVYAFRRNVDLRPVIIMEWIDGESLDQKSEPLPWNETTLNALYSLTSAVSALHRRGWSHLDLKPANIVISSQKREETGRTPLRILDAGLMASTGHSIEPRGTPGYIAPEILKREGWDERADLFSLGGIFYQLLTGRPAFAGPALDEVIDQTLRGAFTPLEICEPSLPPPLCQLVNGLLDPDPKKRPGNGADVINVLERLSVLEGLDPPTIVPNSWQRENALPWPPIPRPETQEIVDSLSSETKALLKILPVTVSSGLGRESFARNLADILSMAGFNASLLMGAQGHFASAKEADTALCAFFSPADLGGISEQRNRKQSLNGFLWNESPILVWDLGTTPPGWLNKWLNDLALELTSISAHSEKGRGTPSLVLLCSHIETPDIPLRTADIQSFSLAPLSPEALRSYTARHLSSEQDIEKIVKQSQGYPEILGGLLEAKRRHQTTITGLSDDKIESPLSILHGLLAARTRILSDSSRRALSMLEMAGIPLTLDLWEELCEGGNLDLRSISIELQNLGLIGCSLKGWETHYADLIDQGRYLIRSPRKEDHIRMAS
ncbi:MAG: serine/threonine protein kinase, partial [Candidatus Eisenbacteria bacterium]|nr:serine/threonine protein kinase [Candidatus Eisenbacteria bacterium]